MEVASLNLQLPNAYQQFQNQKISYESISCSADETNGNNSDAACLGCHHHIPIGIGGFQVEGE